MNRPCLSEMALFIYISRQQAAIKQWDKLLQLLKHVNVHKANMLHQISLN